MYFARRLFAITLIGLLMSTLAWSHGGRTNSSGCHNERKTGGYHCHRTPKKRTPSSTTLNTHSNTPTPQNTLARNVQQKLNTLGFNVGKVDGIAGIKTRGAIRAFQRH